MTDGGRPDRMVETIKLPKVARSLRFPIKRPGTHPQQIGTIGSDPSHAFGFSNDGDPDPEDAL
jgi:hypothetical protein